MEKDIAKIKKNDMTDIVVRVDDFGGNIGVTIREFMKSDTYQGFTKSGTRIPADKFLEFREAINKVDLDDLKSEDGVQKLEKEVEEIESEEKEIKEETI